MRQPIRAEHPAHLSHLANVYLHPVGITATRTAAVPLRVATGRSQAARKVGLPDGRPVAVEVLEWADFERKLEEPAIPERVSAPEVGRMLGGSRQRVHQLLAEHKQFPAPLLRLGSGPGWTAAAIRALDERWTRKPGRPAKERVTAS